MKYRYLRPATLFVGFATLQAQESVSNAGRWSKEQIQNERPAVVTPPGHTTDARPGAMPSDAIVFFDGKDLSKWKGRGKGDDDAAKWQVKDGFMEVVRGTGAIQTRDQVEGDCQWHIEWCTPAEVKGNSQGGATAASSLVDIPRCRCLIHFKMTPIPTGRHLLSTRRV